MGNLKKEDYNSEPVAYCRNCLSLRVMPVDEELEYCDECSGTNIDYTDIFTWEEMYKEKYGFYYIEKK